MKKYLIVALVVLSTFAHAQQYSDFGTIVSVSPNQVPVQEANQVCNSGFQNTNQNGNSIAGSLIGGIAGGLLGNQVGGGNGKTTATAVGAVVGALSGQHIQQQGQGQQQTCQTVYTTVYRQSGYTVVYEYNGRRMSSTLFNIPGNPGDSIRLSVSATPN